MLTVVNVGATYFAFRYIDRMGRRKLAIGGYIGMAAVRPARRGRAGILHRHPADRGRDDRPGRVHRLVRDRRGRHRLAAPGRGVPHRGARAGRVHRRDRGLAGQLRAHRGVPGLAWRGIGLGWVLVCFAAPVPDGHRVRVPVRAGDQGPFGGGDHPDLRPGGGDGASWPAPRPTPRSGPAPEARRPDGPRLRLPRMRGDERALGLLDRPGRHVHRRGRAAPGRHAWPSASCSRRTRAGTRTRCWPVSAGCSGCRTGSPSRPRRSARSGSAPRWPPTRCSSAGVSPPSWSSPGGSATRCGSATRTGRASSPAQIILPELLYSRVIEVTERVSAHGEVIVPLDEEAAARDLRAAYADGLRAVAVVCLHGYRYPAHEARIGADRPGHRVHPGLGVARDQPADEAGVPRGHHGRGRLPVPDPGPLRRPRGW